jgi:hypothetical protein
MSEPKINSQEEVRSILRHVEEQVYKNRSHFDDSSKNLKDFRRIFDQDSSRMNRAILNDHPMEEVYQETLHTVSVLVEILLRARKN